MPKARFAFARELKFAFGRNAVCWTRRAVICLTNTSAFRVELGSTSIQKHRRGRVRSGAGEELELEPIGHRGDDTVDMEWKLQLLVDVFQDPQASTFPEMRYQNKPHCARGHS